MDTYTVIHIEELASEPYWTVVDLTAGIDLREEHQFATKEEAEALADVMNGKLAADRG